MSCSRAAAKWPSTAAGRSATCSAPAPAPARPNRLAEHGLEPDFDKPEPPDQPAECELADLFLRHAEQLARAVTVARRLQRLGHRGQQAAHCVADRFRLLRVVADCFA